MTRLLHVIRKEFLELRQDPRLFGIVIIAPIVQLTMLGYAATTDVRNVPMLVVDEDASSESRDLVSRFEASGNFVVVDRTSSSERWKRFTGVFAGLLVATYITIESPLSGMSMNPARTVASALAAHRWIAVWIYFVAPLTGMLIAAELFVRTRAQRAIPCGKIMHAEPCLFCEHARRAHGR